jgi:hypothetical protein
MRYTTLPTLARQSPLRAPLRSTVFPPPPTTATLLPSASGNLGDWPSWLVWTQNRNEASRNGLWACRSGAAQPESDEAGRIGG